LILSNVTNSRIQGEHRHSFWNEIYETVLSPYILLPTMMALINPKLGKFNVTAKGGVVKRTFFDTKIAQPFLILLVFNLAGILVALPRYFIWDRDRPGTVIMNVIWCFFNVVILGVTTAVAREMKQLRTTVRISLVTPVMAKLADGRLVEGETIDMSSGGTSIRFSEALDVEPLSEIMLAFPLPNGSSELHASVVSSEGSVLRVRFDGLNISEQEVLTMVLYSRADSWLGWGESRESDNVMRSLGRIFQISMHGLLTTFQSLFTSGKKAKKSTSLSAVSSTVIFALAALLTLTGPPLRAQAAINAEGQQAGTAGKAMFPPPPPGQFRDTFSLADAGASQIELHGIDSNHTIYFTLPQTHVPRTAKIHLNYAFSPSLLPQLSHIKLMMNGTLFATVEPTPNQQGATSTQMGEADFPIPPELMVHNNALTIQFIGHYVLQCEDPANSTLWARVHRNTYFDIQGDLLPLADDLKQLPMPFLDPAIVQPLSLPIVFASAPSTQSIQAAGVVSSYFGLISENRPVRFPVHIGELPAGNVIVVSDSLSNLPAGLNMSNVNSPTVAMRTNPNDPFGKVLVIAGGDGEQVLKAAQAVAMHSDLLQGAQTTIESLTLPTRQEADEAPRWVHTEKLVSLVDYATPEQLQGDGSTPVNVYLRLAPDIFYSNRPNAVLRLSYRYNSIPIGPISSMQIRVNNAFLGSIPLVPGQEASRKMQLEVPVPVVNLRPFSNSLSFDFTFQLLKKSNCQDTTPINMQGAILRDTYLDLTGYPHYAPMPNLELFANAGFPFTRFADLGGTTVILPPTPTEQEIEMFVTLMGHFSRQTGYPALRVTVAAADAMVPGAKTDFLVIGTGDDQPGFDKIADNLPVTLTNGKIETHDTAGYYAPLHQAWWKVHSGEHAESGDLVASGTPDAVIEGIESPFARSSSKSIVAIRIKDTATFEPFMSTFMYVQQASDIQGSVSVLLGTRFQSFRIGSSIYHVGLLPWWTQLTLWFMENPWLAAVVVLIVAFLFSIWIRQWLRQKARARLKMIED
jgi:cellulose synthase (UDP-forming)